MSKSMTKGKMKAYFRRRLRRKDNKLNVTTSKMLGKFCRYGWGGGKVSSR